MWSDTGLTLTEFALLMHMDPYRLAQVDRTGTATDECNCYFQNSDEQIGRDELIRAIQFAESTFVNQAKFYPVTTAVVGERQKYPKIRREVSKLFQPRYREVQQFGVLEWTVLDDSLALTRDDGGVIQDVFSATFSVPDDTEADQLHVYITAEDGGGLLPDRAWEIRPLTRVTVDDSGGVGAWTAIIEGPAYLFVRPELYLTTGCLAHELDTYVDSVAIYRATVDACQQGRFVFRSNCNQPPCSEQTINACFEWSGSLVLPHFATCNDEAVLEVVDYCAVPNWPPTHLEMNYLSGPARERGVMNALWADAVFSFALANMDAGLELCPCDKVSVKKYDKYRSVPKTTISQGLGGPKSAQFSLLIDRDDIKRLRGLEPVYGNLRGLGIIRSYTARVSASTM